MSESAKLRKMLRRKKMLGYLETANRRCLVENGLLLVSLQQSAADLDNGWRKEMDTRFLDIRTAYRNLLEPQIRGLSEILTVEAGRAEVLSRRVEDTESDIKMTQARIRDASDLHQLLDVLNRNRIEFWPASRKPTGQ